MNTKAIRWEFVLALILNLVLLGVLAVVKCTPSHVPVPIGMSVDITDIRTFDGSNGEATEPAKEKTLPSKIKNTRDAAACRTPGCFLSHGYFVRSSARSLSTPIAAGWWRATRVPRKTSFLASSS